MAKRKNRSTTSFVYGLVAIALVVGLLVGGIIGYSIIIQEINQLQDQVSTLQDRISQVQGENINYIVGDNTSLSKLYEDVKDSVVMILGNVSQGQVQGSGFVYNLEGRAIIITNFHVVDGTTDITVTFHDGNTYTANVLGTDVYSDLAVLSADAPDSELKPIQIVSSSTLEVGDPVVAVGNPFGLTGSMTVGIVSQLGRTLSESTIGSYSIANIIQTSTAINPGNSGGPLLNYMGQVVGITTAMVANSQGLGFAVPSDTILRELESLVNNGSYTQHSWLGVSGNDMNYEIAKAMGTDVTYGWLVSQVVSGGPSDRAGLHGGTEQVQMLDGRTIMIGGDILIAFDGARIINVDDMMSYLEGRTLPGQTVDLTIVRNNNTMTIAVEVGTRPPPA